jgi:Protein of unknown function (DUF3102)
MTKNARTLDAIAIDIHLRGRTNIIAVGKLLNEAHAACEYGEWCTWLVEFEWSDSTADRYRKVADLVARFPTVGKVQLAPTTLYALTELEEEALPAVIDELGKRATKVFLKVADATEIIEHVVLVRQYGDFPLATLRALEDIEGRHVWSEQAAESLRCNNPTTEDDVRKITRDVQRSYVESLYAAHGELPPVPDDSLYFLENLAEDSRAKMLERLRAAPQPLSADDVQTIWVHLDDDDGDDAPDEDDGVSPDEDDDDLDDRDAPDEGDDDGDGGAPEAPTSVSSRDEPLVTAVKTILAFSTHAPVSFRAGCKAASVSSVDLIAAANFLSEIATALAGNDNATKIADRAEARSRAHREVRSL